MGTWCIVSNTVTYANPLYASCSANLGGLFVRELFISHALFQSDLGAHDKWDLSVNVSSTGNLTGFLT